MIRQRLPYPHPDFGKPGKLTIVLLDAKEDCIVSAVPATLLDLILWQHEEFAHLGLNVNAKVQNEYNGEVVWFWDEFTMLTGPMQTAPRPCWSVDCWSYKIHHARWRLVWQPFKHKDDE